MRDPVTHRHGYRLLEPLLLALLVAIMAAVPALSQCDVGDVGSWIDQNGGQAPTTTMTNVGLEGTGSEDRNDGCYTYNSGTDDVTVDTAGNYLVLSGWKSTDTSGNRGLVLTRHQINGGTGIAIHGSFGAGFKRNASNTHIQPVSASLALNLSANDEISLQVRRGTDANVGTSVAGETWMQIVRLPDDADAAFGHYYDPGGSSHNGTTWNDVQGWDAVRETDTAVIQRVDDATDDKIELKGLNRRYLVLYDLLWFTTSGTRVQRVCRLEADGTALEGAHSYAYIRNSSNQWGVTNGIAIVDVGGAAVDLTLACQRGNGESSTTITLVDSASDTQTGSGLFVMELPSSAEVFASHDQTAAQDLTATSGTLNLTRTVDFNDSASFTGNGTTGLDAAKALDALVAANCRYGRAAGSGGTRLQRGFRFEVEGTDETTFGVDTTYTRNDQSSSGTFDGSTNTWSVFALSANDTVELEWFDRGEDGQSPTNDTFVDECGLFAINLDTFTAAAARRRFVDLMGGG